MESEIQELAAAHAKAAIAVLVEIMKNPRVPSRERLSAAKALLERAFGKATGQKPKQEAPATPGTEPHPPLEGGGSDSVPTSKNAKHFSGRGQAEKFAPVPLPEICSRRSQISTPQGALGRAPVLRTPQGEGGVRHRLAAADHNKMDIQPSANNPAT